MHWTGLICLRTANREFTKGGWTCTWMTKGLIPWSLALACYVDNCGCSHCLFLQPPMTRWVMTFRICACTLRVLPLDVLRKKSHKKIMSPRLRTDRYIEGFESYLWEIQIVHHMCARMHELYICILIIIYIYIFFRRNVDFVSKVFSTQRNLISCA